jgi:hypothetical protein
MEGHCSTGQSPQRAVAPMEEEEGPRIRMHEVKPLLRHTPLCRGQPQLYLYNCKETLPVAELVTSLATVSVSQIAHARKRFTPLPSKACNMPRHDAVIKPVWRGKIICLDWESDRQMVIHMTRIYT